MKSYFADANIFLRFILHDSEEQSLKATSYFTQAKKGKLKIVFLSEIIMEIEYVLRKVYGESREKISEYLSTLVKSPYILTPNRSILIAALELYKKTNFDFVDLVLFTSAHEQGAKVLSFDRDFIKLERLS